MRTARSTRRFAGWTCGVALAALLGGGGPSKVFAQVAGTRPESKEPTRQDAPPATPSRDGTPEQGAPPSDGPTAEDVLRALQRERPSNAIIPPHSVAASGESFPIDAPRLLPEGASLVDRTGTLRRAGDGWEFVFDDEASAVPLKLLFNTTLEAMSRTTAASESPVRFAVSGEVTVFRGENYLMPRVAVRSSAVPPGAVRGGEERPAVPADAAAADVVAALIAEKPLRSIVPPGGVRRGEGEKGGGAVRLLPEGHRFARRPGRVVRRGEAWVFAVESDSDDREAPVLKLLPCANTETMLTQAARDDAGLVFIVSGEVTVFDGENYLLPRVAMRRLAADNLRK